jgi:hypothetical protein
MIGATGPPADTEAAVTYREIPFGFGACVECDQIVEWGKRRARGMPLLLGHGPRNNRCPGSGQPAKPWLDASGLPTWDQMSDLDKGAALMHVWKRKREGGVYARDNYPAEYIEHPDLTGLSRNAACHHAVAVAGRNDDAQDRLGIDEWDRLYNLALDQGQKILDSRKLWAVRYEAGGLLPCDTEDYARRNAADLHAVELLQRTETGGEWTLVEDLRGAEVEVDLRRVRAGDRIGSDDRWRTVESNTVERRGGVIGPGYDVHVITLDTGAVVEVHGHGSPFPDLDPIPVTAQRRAAKPAGATR